MAIYMDLQNENSHQPGNEPNSLPVTSPPALSPVANEDSGSASAVTQAAQLAGLHPSVKQQENRGPENYPRKRWRDYLFEFFMLFLAITLGFFVENKREDISDNRKEKNYIRSLVEDLRSDTLKVDSMMKYNAMVYYGLDSLINSIYQYSPYDPASVARIYRLYTAYARNYYNVNFTDRTMSQLKFAGNMRLIRSQSTSDSIINYEEMVKLSTSQGNQNKDKCDKALEYSTTIFDYRYLRADPANPYNAMQPAAYFKLLTEDPVVFSHYANLLELWRGVIWVYMSDLYWTKIRALNLIGFLKKEYDL